MICNHEVTKITVGHYFLLQRGHLFFLRSVLYFEGSGMQVPSQSPKRNSVLVQWPQDQAIVENQQSAMLFERCSEMRLLRDGKIKDALAFI